MVERAHDGCFIANTLNAEIVIEPVIEHGTDRPLRAGTAAPEDTSR